jgi:alcohol dehydrogenase (cytochrome c)
MFRKLFFVTSIILGMIAPAAFAQVKNFTPVTQEMLLKPSPDDWLMPSRTYDWQRFSPLKQITKQNVGQLRMVWARGMGPGIHENVPIVYHGVMYVANPPSGIQALDATNGDLLWEYKRKLPGEGGDGPGVGHAVLGAARTRAIAIYQDLVYYAAPDGFVVALDARTGALRWETQTFDPKTHATHSAGPVVVNGKVITGRTCATTRNDCFIAAHDALTGKELWRFYTTAAPGEPGGDTWGNLPVEKRIAGPWGLSGSYDPVRNLLYWGTGNVRPSGRITLYNGDLDAVPRSAPSQLYSASTVALNPDTGKLSWYYQLSPGDEWGDDENHERVLIRTALNPDPNAVKWINPRIVRGQERDIMITSGEDGGIFVNDRVTGQFLWATPFPFDTPEFHLSKVDVETGKTFINWDAVAKKDGDRTVSCSGDSRSYWAMAYNPLNNSVYIPYHDMCFEETVEGKVTSLKHIRRPGSDPNAFTGIAKVNVSTGQLQRFYTQHAPSDSAMLATAGELIFWGDFNRRYRAFDADSGKILWEAIVGGIVQNSNITYSVNGKQYVAILTGEGVGGTMDVLPFVPDVKPPRGHNSIYVFALP